MKKILLLLTAITSAMAVQAQITVDSSDIGSIGDQVVYATDDAVTGIMAASPTGAFQTFNYSNLNAIQAGFVKFIAPSQVPGGGVFPNSNLVLSLPSGDFIYTNKSASSLDVDGFYGDILNFGVATSVDLEPNINMMNFPLNYLDSFNESSVVDTVVDDTFTGLFDSLRLKRSMSIISNIDAYGELNLPTLSDTVLRRYDVEVTIDTLWGQIANSWQQITQSNVTTYYYRFIAKDQDYYLLEAEADASGNVISASFQTGNALIASIVQSDDARCYGDNNGYAKVGVIGGTPPYTYLWSNNQTSFESTSLVAGNYSVTVTDAMGDTSSAATVIGQPDSITIVSTQIGDDHGLNDGYIFINVTGGQGTYTYVWSNTETTKNIENLSFGNYSVVVTDANNCINTATFTVGNLTSVQDIRSSTTISLYPNPSSGLVTIDLDNEWQMELFNTTGKKVMSSQGVGKETINISNLENGLYLVKIIANGQEYVGKVQLSH